MNSTNHNDLSEHILKLEQKLLKPETRTSAKELSELLADDFIEFASNGKAYNKPEIINALQASSGEQMSISDFELRVLSDKVMMATYQAIFAISFRLSIRDVAITK